MANLERQQDYNANRLLFGGIHYPTRPHPNQREQFRHMAHSL